MPLSRAFTATLDTREQERLLRRFKPAEVERILNDAAKHGAKEATEIMKAHAPIGTSDRPSQYYRAHGLDHGTFRKTVKATKIRREIGYRIGPAGKNAFTRLWIERATGWVARVAGNAFGAARRGSEAVLDLYARD